jgi:hypothetical protein
VFDVVGLEIGGRPLEKLEDGPGLRRHSWTETRRSQRQGPDNA